MTKYQFNQAVFLVAFASQFVLFFTHFGIFTTLASFVCLHYLSNILHIASHNGASKNRNLNQIIGWLCCAWVFVFTFADFCLTHKEHHKFQGDKQKDPDYKIIAGGSVFLLPFRIVWVKDATFWNYNKLRPQYLAQRFVQLIFLGVAFVFFRENFVFNWVLPLLLVGFCNSLFLYFLPHYTNKFFAKLDFGIFGWLTQIARVSHDLHHQKVSNNLVYYPEFWIQKVGYSHISKIKIKLDNL
jgi:fatty acid desaturase